LHYLVDQMVVAPGWLSRFEGVMCFQVTNLKT
jgi:hypothetical protein